MSSAYDAASNVWPLALMLVRLALLPITVPRL
jgi:hypothetical protein